jgi:ATP-dependent RNA helicase DeaD
LIVPQKSRKKAERILQGAKVRATWGPPPSADAVRAKDEERMLADPVWADEIPEDDLPTIEALTAKFSPAQLASAYLKLFHDNHSAPEELTGIDEPAKPRAPFGPSVWFAVEGGRGAGAEPRRLLPMVCKIGGLSKDDIGAIRIREDQSFVEILASRADAFVASVGSDMTLEGAALTRLASTPDLGGPPPRSDAPRAPAKSHRKGTTTPVVWDDAPEPRAKKPKVEGKAPYKAKTARAEDFDGAVVPHSKPRHKSTDGPKGPPPPKGKSNSKKNQARKVATKAAKNTKR